MYCADSDCLYVLFYLSSFIIFVLFIEITLFFFFNDTATTEIYTLSLHDALPIFRRVLDHRRRDRLHLVSLQESDRFQGERSEEHTSELQSRLHLVCRLLLEKKKKKKYNIQPESNK